MDAAFCPGVDGAEAAEAVGEVEWGEGVDVGLIECGAVGLPVSGGG